VEKTESKKEKEKSISITWENTREDESEKRRENWASQSVLLHHTTGEFQPLRRRPVMMQVWVAA